MSSRPAVGLARVDLADPADRASLADLLAGEDWPFHAGGRPTPAEVRTRLVARDPQDDASYWICEEGSEEPLGVVQLHGLGDDTAEVDLRVRARDRGRGVGSAALRAASDLVFATVAGVHRFEGTTREDNVAMRRTFAACGFVQEACYRQAWPTVDGGLLDSVGYALLRSDWASGTTTPVRWEPACSQVIR